MEGIGVGTLRQNFKTVAAQDPVAYKFIYATYGNTEPTQTVLQTNKFYNKLTQALDNLPAGTFNIFIPCITPTGQFLLRPFEASGAGGFLTMDTAMQAIVSAQFTAGSYASRLIYLGFAIVVKAGETDFTNSDNFRIVAVMPNELAYFDGLAGAGVPPAVPDFSNLGKGVIKGKTQDGYVTESGDNDATGKVYGFENTVKTLAGTEGGITFTKLGDKVVMCANESDANALLNLHPDWIAGY